MHMCVDIKRWTLKVIIKRKMYKVRSWVYRFISLAKPYKIRVMILMSKMQQKMSEMRNRRLRHFSISDVYRAVETNKIWLKGIRVYHLVNVEYCLASHRKIVFIMRILELIKKWDSPLDETIVTTSRFNK